MGSGHTFDDGDTPEAKEILDIGRTNYFKIGIWLTGAYILIAAIYGAVFWNWRDFIGMDPNEFGDFLAGIFGPLVLLWVVMGFLQQGAELKYSREALLLQAKELKASVEAQKNMGEAAWAGVHAERDARALAENDRIRALQPVFTLHNYTHSSHTQAAETIFTLANSGKDGIDLQLAILGATFEIHPQNAAKFTASERTQVYVVARPKTELKECLLQICYKDVEGRPAERQFLLQTDGEFLRVVDPFGSPT
jgi:hypothetical protein